MPTLNINWIIVIKMTPLFPGKNKPLTLQQGPVDDCYLLVALDCIFNSGDEARDLLASKFKRTPVGLSVRIKRNNQSTHLKTDKMSGKYIHTYDRLTDEDVFFLSNQKLKEIDDSPKGVKSNSLAVKVLERISAYYYIGDWEHAEFSTSLTAHSISQRFSETSTRFVGKLLGVLAKDSEDIDEIIKLKLMNPNEAIYTSMAYGEPDDHGKIHDRHALRVDRIINKGNGNYDFVLVNPWDNQKQEVYSSDDLKNRDCRFCTFSTNQQKAELTTIFLKNPVAQGQYIYANPELFNLLFQMKKMNLLLKAKNIQKCINLHKQMPYLASLFNLLTEVDQKKMIQGIVDTKGDKEKFIEYLITKIPHMGLVKTIFQHEDITDKTRETIVDAALEVKRNSGSTARVIFEAPEFFALVMNKVISQKAIELSCTLEKSRQQIELKLIEFYFDITKIKSIPRNAGFRDLFTGKIFTKTSIETWFSSRLSLADVDLPQALKTLGFSARRPDIMSIPAPKKEINTGSAPYGFFNGKPSQTATQGKKSSIPSLPPIFKKPSIDLLAPTINKLSIHARPPVAKESTTPPLPLLSGFRIVVSG